MAVCTVMSDPSRDVPPYVAYFTVTTLTAICTVLIFLWPFAILFGLLGIVMGLILKRQGRAPTGPWWIVSLVVNYGVPLGLMALFAIASLTGGFN